MLHSLEGLAERLGQGSCQDVLSLPQAALLGLDGVAGGQLLLWRACMQQVLCFRPAPVERFL